MQYFDIYDMLAKEERVVVKFPHKTNFHGFLSHSKKQSVSAGKKVDVPIFFLDFILQNEHCSLAKDIISPEIRDDLDARPTSVCLGDLSRCFYRLCNIFYPQDTIFFYNVFLERIKWFLQKLIEKNLEEEDFLMMDNDEARIIRSTLESTRAYQKIDKNL